MKQFFEGLIDTTTNKTEPTESRNFLKGLFSFLLSQDKEYYNDMVQYQAPDFVTANCAEITFYNIGTSTMTVNGVPFSPGTGIAFDGKKNETDKTKYTINFSGAGVNLCFVIRKVYR